MKESNIKWKKRMANIVKDFCLDNDIFYRSSVSTTRSCYIVIENIYRIRISDHNPGIFGSDFDFLVMPGKGTWKDCVKSISRKFNVIMMEKWKDKIIHDKLKVRKNIG